MLWSQRMLLSHWPIRNNKTNTIDFINDFQEGETYTCHNLRVIKEYKSDNLALGMTLQDCTLSESEYFPEPVCSASWSTEFFYNHKDWDQGFESIWEIPFLSTVPQKLFEVSIIEISSVWLNQNFSKIRESLDISLQVLMWCRTSITERSGLGTGRLCISPFP